MILLALGFLIGLVMALAAVAFYNRRLPEVYGPAEVAEARQAIGRVHSKAVQELVSAERAEFLRSQQRLLDTHAEVLKQVQAEGDRQRDLASRAIIRARQLEMDLGMRR